MLFKKIKTPGLSHLSYLIGSGGKAAVIDPRRDCDIYLETARAEGLEITHIFETHRNEDLVSGAPILSDMTDAKVFHGPNAGETSSMRQPPVRETVSKSDNSLSRPSKPLAIPTIISLSRFMTRNIRTALSAYLLEMPSLSVMSVEPISTRIANAKWLGFCSILCEKSCLWAIRR